jgi:formamidopyrimidine-DNA glycosylase
LIGDVPEGHTLHRLAALHTRRYVGRPVGVSSPQGRFATDAELVDGRALESADAHGKHLFHHTTGARRRSYWSELWVISPVRERSVPAVHARSIARRM